MACVPGLDHVGLVCASRGDVVAWAEQLDRVGVMHSGVQGAADGPALSFRRRGSMSGPKSTSLDWEHLRRCVELAEQALATGDEPFGSVLVDADGNFLAEERNQVVSSADPTRHPEFALARWAAEHMTVQDRAQATVYTSGEHCPMCSAAHGWVGLGRIVYVHSARQLAGWLADLGLPPGPVRPIAVGDVAPGVLVDGPIPELAEQMHQLHLQSHQRAQAQGVGTPGQDTDPR